MVFNQTFTRIKNQKMPAGSIKTRSMVNAKVAPSNVVGVTGKEFSRGVYMPPMKALSPMHHILWPKFRHRQTCRAIAICTDSAISEAKKEFKT